MAKKMTNNRKKSRKLSLDNDRVLRDKKAKTKPKKKPIKKADKYDDVDFINPQRVVGKSRSYPNVSRPAPPKNQPRKQIKKKVNPKSRNQEFLGKNVAGSGVYEDEFYDNRLKKKKKPTSSRHTTRRSLKIFTYAAIVGVVVVLGITLSLTVFFKTAQYEVQGKTRYDKQEIINACGIKKGENIFLADKQKASENIINSFPYIAQADVSFGFPDKIVIEVTEGKASYMVKYAKKDFCVVSKEGRILKNSKKKISDLPLVKGLILKSNVPGTYVEYNDKSMSTALDTIVESVDKCGLDKLTEINVSDKANLTFTYDKRILVKLGVPENIDYKIRTANSIISEKLDPNNTGIIQGTLDVSQCKETKKSYFNEKSIVTTNTEDATTETTVAVWDYGYDYNAGQDTYVDPYAGYDAYTDYNTYGYYDEGAGVVQ